MNPAQHQAMMLQPQHQSDERRGGGLWVLLAGFALAALLTLGAAVGASLLQQQLDVVEPATEVPMAQR